MRAARQPSSVRLLYRLFLKLAVRGPVAHWLTVGQTPNSPFRLAAGSLMFLGWSLVALVFWHRPQGNLVWYLHATTLLLLPIYLAVAGGELWLDREERLILGPWPVTGRSWYRAKFLVLAQTGGWAALALNLTGALVGTFGSDGKPWFGVVHLLAVGVETAFCLACVMIAYQVLPRLPRVRRASWVCGIGGLLAIGGLTLAWGYREGFPAAGVLLPPVWFVDLDEAWLGGRFDEISLALWGIGVAGTLIWLALSGRMAAESFSLEALRVRDKSMGRSSAWLTRFLRSRLATLGLSLSAERAAFAVTVRYIVRSRDLRSRLLANLALLYALPLLLLLAGRGRGAFGEFTVAALGSFLPLHAFLAIYSIEMSSDWQAAQIFRWAPLLGPAEICAGARRAVLLVCVAPTFVLYAAIVWILRDASSVLLLLPGAILAPLVACLPNAIGRGIPLGIAPDSSRAPAAQSAYVWIFPVLVVALAATLLQGTGYFWLILFLEVAGVCAFDVGMRRKIYSHRWG